MRHGYLTLDDPWRFMLDGLAVEVRDRTAVEVRDQEGLLVGTAEMQVLPTNNEIAYLESGDGSRLLFPLFLPRLGYAVIQVSPEGVRPAYWPPRADDYPEDYWWVRTFQTRSHSVIVHELGLAVFDYDLVFLWAASVGFMGLAVDSITDSEIMMSSEGRGRWAFEMTTGVPRNVGRCT